MSNDGASRKHNEALLPLLRIVVDSASNEAAQWVILESLCLGIGKLHNRSGRETAEFIGELYT